LQDSISDLPDNTEEEPSWSKSGEGWAGSPQKGGGSFHAGDVDALDALDALGGMGPKIGRRAAEKKAAEPAPTPTPAPAPAPAAVEEEEVGEYSDDFDVVSPSKEKEPSPPKQPAPVALEEMTKIPSPTTIQTSYAMESEYALAAGLSSNNDTAAVMAPVATSGRRAGAGRRAGSGAAGPSWMSQDNSIGGGAASSSMSATEEPKKEEPKKEEACREESSPRLVNPTPSVGAAASIAPPAAATPSTAAPTPSGPSSADLERVSQLKESAEKKATQLEANISNLSAEAERLRQELMEARSGNTAMLNVERNRLEAELASEKDQRKLEVKTLRANLAKIESETESKVEDAVQRERVSGRLDLEKAVKLAEEEGRKQVEELRRHQATDTLKAEALQADVANMAQVKEGFNKEQASLAAKHTKELEGMKAYYERQLKDKEEEPKQASAIADMAHAVEHSSHEIGVLREKVEGDRLTSVKVADPPHSRP